MKMLFLRDFHGVTGGHLKYWNYLDHTKRLPGIDPELYLTPATAVRVGFRVDLSEIWLHP
jgi:hypothetical protein